jgi:glycerol uptake facilitator-like aquaporin
VLIPLLAVLSEIRLLQHDWITNGSQVNPAVSVATTLYGWNTPDVAVVRIVGQLIGGTAAFPAIARVLPAYVNMGGPTLSTDLLDGCLWEFSLTAGLLLLVYSAATQVRCCCARYHLLVIQRFLCAAA